MIERDLTAAEYSYRVTAPGANRLHAQVSFPGLVPPNMETDHIAITIPDPANPAITLRRVCLQGKNGLLDWLNQNTANQQAQSLQTIDLIECVASYIIAETNDSLARSLETTEIRQFQSAARALLKARYGIDLNDTHLHAAAVVADCIKHGFSPSEVVEEHAREADLTPLDRSPYGLHRTGALPAQKLRAS